MHYLSHPVLVQSTFPVAVKGCRPDMDLLTMPVATACPSNVSVFDAIQEGTKTQIVDV